MELLNPDQLLNNFYDDDKLLQFEHCTIKLLPSVYFHLHLIYE